MIIPRYHFLTDRGIVREENEDFYFTPDAIEASLLDQNGRLFAVADGMGGHTGGQTASRMICKALAEFYQTRLVKGKDEAWEVPARVALDKLIERISKYVYGCRYLEEEKYMGMGSTLTGALIHHNIALIFNIGDSRVYHLSVAKGFYQVSRDHSKVQALIDQGLITPEGAENHPDANVITRSLGMSPINDDGRPDIKTVQLAGGDQLLLCSDGLTGLVPFDKIATSLLLAGKELERAAKELLEFALAEGGYDNITIGLVQMIPDEGNPQPQGESIEAQGVEEMQEVNLTSGKEEDYGKDKNGRNLV